MRIPTQNQWKFQGLAESLAQMIKRDPDIVSNNGLLEEFLLHAFDKVYGMGQTDPIADSSAVPVTDLSDIPELFERAKDRWRDGSCH
jgi:hypothetical protein